MPSMGFGNRDDGEAATGARRPDPPTGGILHPVTIDYPSQERGIDIITTEANIMPDDLLAHIDAMLTREMSTSARFLAEVRRLAALAGTQRTVIACICPNGHCGAIYYALPEVVRCPVCGVSDVANDSFAARSANVAHVGQPV